MIPQLLIRDGPAETMRALQMGIAHVVFARVIACGITILVFCIAKRGYEKVNDGSERNNSPD